MIDSIYKLNIEVDCSCNFLLCYAYPLCILEASNSFTKWNQQNYINHYFSYDEKRNTNTGIVDAFELGAPFRVENSFFILQEIPGNRRIVAEDIIEYIITNIQSQTYVILFLEGHELWGYSKEHVHEYLIFGYDLMERVFYSLFYKDDKFGVYKIEFNKLVQAYISLGNNLDLLSDQWKERCIISVQPIYSEINNLEYSPEIFLNKLKNYYEGIGITSISTFDKFESEKAVYGINTCMGLGLYLEDLNEFDKKINALQIYDLVKTLQLFYQHRKGLHRRLDGYYHFIKEKSVLLDKYKIVVDKLQQIKLCTYREYIKSIHNSNYYPGKKLLYIAECLKETYIEEKNILNCVLETIL